MQAEHVRLRTEPCESPAAWDAFVERQDAPPTTTWRWGNALESLGHDRYYLAATADGDVVGALPLFHVRSRLFGDQLVSVPFTAHGSLVAADGFRKRARDRLLEQTRLLADALDVDVVSLRNRDLGSVEGFVHERRYVTYLVSLDGGPDAVWERMDSSRRNHVRQAEQAGVRVRAGDDEEDLRAFYDLYLRTMRSHGSPPHSYGFFERLWEEFHADGTLRLLLAEYEGTPTNAVINFASESRVYEWKGVSDPDYRGLDGGSLIEWTAIERAAEDGFDRYGHGRTRDDSGVAAFKRSFGGEKVWMDDYHYFPGGAVDLPDPERGEYDRVTELWRRVPLPVTRLVGPHIRKSITL
jgi:FemAB-related protein (PEP-CTERM system-associated)